MMGILKLLGINVDKWVIYAIGITILVSAAFGSYMVWKHNVEANAQMEFNVKQLEQALADKDKYIASMHYINDLRDKQIAELETQAVELNKKLADVDAVINSPEAIRDDRESSPVLKNTVRELKKATGR